MSSPKERNSIWYFLLLLPIAASILATVGGFAAFLGVVCLVIWFAFFKGSQDAFRSGNGTMWPKYVFTIPGVRNGKSVQPQPAPPQPQAALWNRSAPAFDKQRLTATLESLKWNQSTVDAMAAEAGEDLQYGLAFRCQYGRVLPHSQRIESIQMAEIASAVKSRLPQGAVCRAWPLFELSKGLNMDGLLVVPDRNKPLGLYCIIAGNKVNSRFTVFSMFVPVCIGKAEWIKRIYQPSAAELKAENELADMILRLSEQLVS